ncbi:hypothetical protein GC105_03845 [Alkalibaculum sp. M08DMB]|uniref:Hydroxymyristoyl-ACP dehydratase n=1 Tax=Alkalibaculum sporogenes TaxID=2655001 RepID=A0A6A7K727_9FIRM|nr:hypothetical protein [Alkalibaculum sporogenes]MPW24923.1 hypothetical protein [Alkalibaculum sporogenes]
MTTINCISNCIYQKNGKCALQNVQSLTSSAIGDCAYFTSNVTKEIHKDEASIINDLFVQSNVDKDNFNQS